MLRQQASIAAIGVLGYYVGGDSLSLVHTGSNPLHMLLGTS
jgi:hypothetical protein